MSVDSEAIPRCDCGRPLHYENPLVGRSVRKLVAEHGPTVEVITASSGPVYLVPRHYIALHGLKAAELPALAAQYGWQVKS